MRKTSLLTALLFAIATMTSAQTWIDVTNEFVKNPNFDGTIDGWTDEYAYGAAQNHGFQNASYYYNGVSVWQFAEAWRDKNDWWTGGRLGDAAISQQLTNMPTGRFRLEADAIAVDQSGRNNPVTGVYLFISDETNEATTQMATGDGRPEHFSVEFNTAKTAFTIGVRTESATANWMAFDNVQLYWYGQEVKVTRITLDKTSTKMTQGEQLQLTPTITPSNATYKGVYYTTSNEAVASVDANGIVTARRPGIATITVTSDHYENVQARCIITVEANEVAANAVIINEIQQANVDMFLDPSFNFGGWIELYNATDKTVALDGLYISDDMASLKKFALTSSRQGTIPAKGFLALWFDHYSRWSPNTIGFKLDCDGGSLFISDEAGTILSQINYPPAITRTSYARTTNGGNSWSYTDQPTPGASNASSKFAATRLAAPVINHEGGFFTESFTARVIIPTGCTLRYTTDGSTPTRDNGATSTDGRFDIGETTILRLRLFKTGELASPVVTRSFIYKDRNYTLPVISLVSDNENLYGYDYGIFVQGNGNGRPGNGQSSACNWNMEWDRPANIEYFTEEGVAAFNQEVGIEASGGWSRAWYPHSFNIKANKIYEGLNRMDYQFFSNKPYLRHKALKVRNGGNDVQGNGGRIKDAAIQQVVATSGLYAETQSYQPVHVFHNGQYIGVENLREPNNKNYALANYGIDTEDDQMDQWKMSPDSGYVQQVGTKDVFDEWYSLAQNASDALAYERIKEIVDIEEYINYCAIELYIAGTDWPKNNIKAFRARTEGNANSRFRFVLFDTDGAFATNNAFTWFESTQWWTFDQLYGQEIIAEFGNRIYEEIEFTTLLLNMWQNEEFRKQFIDQFCIITGSVFQPARAREIINAMVSYVNPAMSLEGRSASSSANSVISSLSSSRQSSSISNMRNYFGLSTPMRVTLSADLPEAKLQINGLEVPTNAFSGQLFAPITVSATAPAGYRFTGWTSNRSTSATTLFSKGSSWSYYDQGSLDGEDWTASTYSNTWSTGAAPLGYFTSDASNARGYKTFLDYGGNANSKYPTYYFSKQVTLSNAPQSAESFTLDWVADDGFVVYVNGKEAGRFLMNNTPSPTFNSFSDTYAEANPEAGQLSIDASFFKKGTNVIAVEVHNNAANSTDIYWDAALLYNKNSSSNIVSTEPSYQVPTSNSSVTLTAVFEKMSTTDNEAWDAHPVKINEVSADNDIFVSDLFKKSDWIELYNTTDEEIDVEGMFLSDHLDQPEKWQITAGNTDANTIIPAHGHLVIWADKAEGISQLHADFKLNNEDNSLILLTAADKSWADTLTYCRHEGFHSVGLYPDGGTQLYVMERPTIDATNVLTTHATAWNEPHTKPIVDRIDLMSSSDLALSFDGVNLTLQGAEAARLDIFTPAGQLVMTTRIQAHSPVNITRLPHGIYVARAKTDDDDVAIKITLQ